MIRGMSQEIDLGGVKVPAADWEATPESIKEAWLEMVRQMNKRLTKLETENEQLRQQVAQLVERQRRNSKNSSQPPSQDGFGGKKAKGDGEKKQRKPLKLTRLEGKKERELYASEQCQAVYEVRPQVCSECGSGLNGEDTEPQRHQVVEVPPLEPEVVEYRLHQLECEHCGKKTRAELPAGVSPRCYGERLAGLIGLLSSGEYRQSHRQVQSFLQAVFGIELSRGSINRVRQEVNDAVAAAVVQAHTYVQHQPVINCDETGFAQGNQDGGNPQRRRGWLWVLVTPLVSVFAVGLSRSQAIAQQLLGAAFGGCLGSDRCSSYGWLDSQQRQLSWARLTRDFQAMAERSGVSQEIGEALLRRAYRLFHWWHRVRDATLSQELFVEAVQLLRLGLQAELQQAAQLPIAAHEKTPLAKTVRTCAQLLKVESALWTFVTTPGVEPTNNAAERALRPAVIWRLTSFGSQSRAGSEFVARMLTVGSSLKAQQRSVLEFLTQSCRSARLGVAGPSLLPLAQPSSATSLSPPQTLITL